MHSADAVALHFAGGAGEWGSGGLRTGRRRCKGQAPQADCERGRPAAQRRLPLPAAVCSLLVRQHSPGWSGQRGVQHAAVGAAEVNSPPRCLRGPRPHPKVAGHRCVQKNVADLALLLLGGPARLPLGRRLGGACKPRLCIPIGCLGAEVAVVGAGGVRAGPWQRRGRWHWRVGRVQAASSLAACLHAP